MFQIGRNIKTIRQFTDLSQLGFAEAFDVMGRNGKPSVDMVSSYEIGRTVPPPDLLRKLAKCSGIDYKKLTSEYITLDDLTEVTLPQQLSNEAQASSFQDPEVGEQGFKEKYYAQLEETNQLLKTQVSILQSKLEQMEKRLEMIDRIEKRQITIAKFQSQADETLLNFVATQLKVKDVPAFLEEVYNKPPSVPSLLAYTKDTDGLDNSGK